MRVSESGFQDRVLRRDELLADRLRCHDEGDVREGVVSFAAHAIEE